MVIASTFWDFFFVMLIWVPLMVVWFGSIADLISRPDISGWTKAAWMVAVVVLPFLGTLIYVIVRPRVFERPGAVYRAGDGGSRGPADDLATLARLHDTGSLSDTEFVAAKARLIA